MLNQNDFVYIAYCPCQAPPGAVNSGLLLEFAHSRVGKQNSNRGPLNIVDEEAGCSFLKNLHFIIGRFYLVLATGMFLILILL